MVTFNNLEFIAPYKIQNDDSQLQQLINSLLQSIPYKSLLLFICIIYYISNYNQPG